MSRERHLIAIDLDGTLLDNDQKISKKNKQAIAQAVKDGHVVVIATGRPRRASIQYYHQLNLQTPMINFNGALIHHPTNTRWKSTHIPIEQTVAHKIFDTCYELDVPNLMAEVQDNVFLDRYDEKVIQMIEHLASEESEATLTIGTLKQKLTEDPTTILITPSDEQFDALEDELSNSHAEFIEHRNWGAPWPIIEINRKGVHKARGVKKVAEYFGIPQERIIAFGDEDNDLEMIDYAGVGVAMRNAIDELKSVAKHVTSMNVESGVGTFLEKYLQLDPIHK
ncbi:MAG TPA: Cof-type HAD-IIB family hydrolase [Bacillota bacterium]|nr:Cof-type HAD-IIB family hydrolase [Bacillota bacterium]